LPARYVSGYLVTKPPPGQRRLIGADASHAWISAFIPDHGWVDFDPTNDLMPSDQHITIGWARDYDDISPVKGITIGGHSHSLKFSVDVEAMIS
jgi:transglutaminase-like putative cysteine protease